MPPKDVYSLHAGLFRTLAHPLRAHIADLLQQGELCFTDILEKTGGLKSNLSQHLSIMVAGGILQVRKNSRCNYYRLASPKVARTCSLMKEILIENLEEQKKLLKNTRI